MSAFDPQDYDPSVIETDFYDQPNLSNQVVEPVENLNDITKRRQAERNKTSNKKDTAEKQTGSFWTDVLNFFTDRRTHGVLGIALILFAAYVLVASLSYVVSGNEDLSVITKQSGSADNVENIAGPVGAVMSQVYLTEALGLGSLVMIFYLTTIGLALLRVIKRINFWSLTFKCLLIAITVSMVVGLVTYNFETVFSYGGFHGNKMNELLIAKTGWIGAVCVSLFLISCIVFIYLNELITLYKAYRRKVEEMRRREQEARLEREERERRVQESVTDEVLSAAEETEQPAEHGGNELVDFSNDTGVDQTEDDPYIRRDTTEPQIVGAEEHAEEEPEQQETDNIQDDVVSEEEGIENLRGMSERSETVEEPETDVVVNVTASIEQADDIMSRPYDPTAELSHFHFPSIDLLKEYETKENIADLRDIEANKQRIAKTLKDYGISISRIEATVGPTITLFEIIPVEGTRIQQIKRLGDDLMLSLAALGIRIIAPIPGKRTIGIEVPNSDPQTVSIRSILSSKAFQECDAELPMAMGTTISNKVYIADLTRMPHLLVAGATGQGKSVGLNTIIASLLYKKHPATLKFVLIDPKMVEFSLYKVIANHYLAKLPDEENAIITAPDRAVTVLQSLCVEMDNRYTLLSEAGCRSVKEYNAKFMQRRLNPEKGHRYMPYIVIIVDEFADLIMTAGKEIETPIARIAQKARAVGMHTIIATQRPSTNVITGVIKANFPARMAFKVAQGIDSKTIIDRPGANQLIGKGDMLISANGQLERVQCAFIDTPEVEAICKCIEEQPGYDHPYILPEYVPENSNVGNAGAVADRDPLFEEAARIIVQSGTASTSSLQRRYSIGYNRAGKIMDQMEAAGIVGPSMGGKPRQVLLDPMALEHLLEQL